MEGILAQIDPAWLFAIVLLAAYTMVLLRIIQAKREE